MTRNRIDRLRSFAVMLGLAVSCAACGPKAAPREDHQDHAHGHAAAPARTPGADGHDHGKAETHTEQAVALEGVRGIRFFTVPEPRAEGAWFPGEAIGDEASQAVLTAPVGGVVTTPPTAPGRPVAKGAILLTLRSPELAELKSRWLSAEARRERADLDLAREERLAAAGATSRRDLEAARVEAAVARAEAESARLGLSARGVPPEKASESLSIDAPGNGSVLVWRVRMGEGVQTGQELGTFQLSSAGLVRVELPPPAPGWSLGDETNVRASDGSSWRARVAGVPSVLSPDSRRLTYRLRLTTGPLPFPGKPVEVHIPFAAAVALPQRALQQIEGTWGVFVREGETAVFRPVRRGAELGGDVAVLGGVHPGESVVADGAYLLKALLLKRKGVGDDHDH